MNPAIMDDLKPRVLAHQRAGPCTHLARSQLPVMAGASVA